MSLAFLRRLGPGKCEPVKIAAHFSESTGKGRIWDVVLIVEGWSLNNRYYPADVLREAIPLFEGTPISVYGYGQGVRDHVPPEIRDEAPSLVMNVAGWATKVREDVENGKVRLVATFKCANERVRELLYSSQQLGELPFGLSIDAMGEGYRGVAEGRTGTIVTKLVHVNETTLVDRPAAGGKFLRLVASLGKERGETEMTRSSDFLNWLVNDKSPRRRRHTESEFGVPAPPIPPAPAADKSNNIAMMLELAAEFMKAGNNSAAQAVLAKLPQLGASDAMTEEDAEQGPELELDQAVKQLRALADEAESVISKGPADLSPLLAGLDEFVAALEELETNLQAPGTATPKKPPIAEAYRRGRR